MLLQENMHHILLVTATYFFSHTRISCCFCCILMLRQVIRKVKLFVMHCFKMLINALCVIFLMKLRWPKNKSLSVTVDMTHSRLGMILPSYLVSRLSFPSKRGRVAEKPWKRCWYKTRKDPNFRKIIPLMILSKLQTKNSRTRPGIKHKHTWKPQHLYIVRGNQFTISITIYY